MAIWTGRYFGIKFSTCGMSVFGASPRRPHPNHCRIFSTSFGALPGRRWIKRVMAWQVSPELGPSGLTIQILMMNHSLINIERRTGRPKYCQDNMFANRKINVMENCSRGW